MQMYKGDGHPKTKNPQQQRREVAVLARKTNRSTVWRAERMKSIRRFRPILAQQITKPLGGSSLLSSGNNEQDLAPDSNSQGTEMQFINNIS